MPHLLPKRELRRVHGDQATPRRCQQLVRSQAEARVVEDYQLPQLEQGALQALEQAVGQAQHCTFVVFEEVVLVQKDRFRRYQGCCRHHLSQTHCRTHQVHLPIESNRACALRDSPNKVPSNDASATCQMMSQVNMLGTRSKPCRPAKKSGDGKHAKGRSHPIVHCPNDPHMLPWCVRWLAASQTFRKQNCLINPSATSL